MFSRGSWGFADYNWPSGGSLKKRVFLHCSADEFANMNNNNNHHNSRDSGF